MPRATVITSNFTGGEVSDRFIGRTDTQRYYNSLQILENNIILPQGGFERRPGTTFVGFSKTAGDAVRLHPFTGPNGLQYILEFGDQYIRVFLAGNQHMYVHEVAATVSAPWAITEIFDLVFAATFDRMYIFHPSHEIHKLENDGTSTGWDLTKPTFTGTTFSAADDYPRCGTFHEQRLYVAGTDNNPNSVWGSVIGDFEDFTIGVADDDAFEFPIASDRYERIEFLASKGDVMIGTNQGEYIMSAGGGVAITPTSVLIKRQSRYGCSKLHQVVNENVFFVTSSTRKLRMYQFVQDADAYVAPDLTIMADHAFADEALQTDLSINPDTIMWVVNDDGELVGLTYETIAGVSGWHRHTTDGLIESIAVVRNVSGEDEIWWSVLRNVSGETRRHIEWMRLRRLPEDQDDLIFLDSTVTQDDGSKEPIVSITNTNPAVATFQPAMSFVNDDMVKATDMATWTWLNGNYYVLKNLAGSSFDLYHEDGTTPVDGTVEGANETVGNFQEFSTVVTGLDHLEGETVGVVADGGAHPDEVVSSSQITLDRKTNVAQVGKKYRSIGLPMRPEAGQVEGTSQDRRMRISRATLRMYQTLGGKVGPNLDELEEMQFREGDALMDTPPPLFTGDKGTYVYSDFDTRGDLYIVQDQPFPMTVLSLILRLETNE